MLSFSSFCFYLCSVQGSVEVTGLDHRPTVVEPVQGFKPTTFPSYIFHPADIPLLAKCDKYPNLFIFCYYHFLYLFIYVRNKGKSWQNALHTDGTRHQRASVNAALWARSACCSSSYSSQLTCVLHLAGQRQSLSSWWLKLTSLVFILMRICQLFQANLHEVISAVQQLRRWNN